MFVHQSRLYAQLLTVTDIAAGFAALILSYYSRYHVSHLSALGLGQRLSPQLLPLADYFSYFAIFLPVWTIVLLATQQYSDILHLPVRRQLERSLRFVLIVAILMGFLSYSFSLVISRSVFFGFLLSTGLLLALNRITFHWVLRSRNINEHNQIKILIVGTDERAMQIARLLEKGKVWGLRVVGHLSPGDPSEDEGEARVLGGLKDLPVLLQDQVVVDEVIFAGTYKQDLDLCEEMIQFCEQLGIRTRLVADFFPTSISRVSIEYLESLPLVTFSTVPEHNIAIIAKRVVDFMVAATALVALSPVIFLVAAAIKFTSRGPVFYRQNRCGLYGRRFKLIKFRTMIDGAEDKLWEIRHLNEMNGPVFKMRNDPRVTPLGKFLRRSSIDEIPQLWNVIKGEMSVVGPRAPLPEEVKHYSLQQRRRLSVKPGITCLWQVSGRSDIDFHEWMAMDLQYIDNWSFWLDLQIMLWTVPAVFSGRGAR